MKVCCSKCPAKYSIADEKVSRRKLRIRCKKCGASIYIDGTRSPATISDAPPAADHSDTRQQAPTIRPSARSPDNGARVDTQTVFTREPHSEPRLKPNASESTNGIVHSNLTRSELNRTARSAATHPKRIGPIRAPNASHVDKESESSSILETAKSEAPRQSPARTSLSVDLGRRAKDAGGHQASLHARVDSTKPESSSPAGALSRTNTQHEKQSTGRAKRRLHQTLLGGLSPASGSAPTPPESPKTIRPATVWLVALSEELQEEKTTEQVIALLAQGMIDSETVVWREGMDQWQGLFEIPELARVFSERGIEPRAPRMKPPGSGVRDVSPVESSELSPSGEPLPSFDLPAERPTTDNGWNDDKATVIFESPLGTMSAASIPAYDNLDVEDEATVALDSDEAQHSLIGGPREVNPNDDDAPTKLVNSMGTGSTTDARAPLPAAGRPATARKGPPSFPAPPAPNASVAVPTIRPFLAAPRLDLVAPPQPRSYRTAWVIAFALFVTIVVGVAIAKRLL